MQEKWVVSAKKADFNAWGEAYGIDPVLARIIRNRGIESAEELGIFLNGSMEDCHDPFLMKNMRQAVEILQASVLNHKKIRIIGDYDVDGICATHILKSSLKSLGVDVDAAIPHRILDGYGLNENLIESAITDGVEVIITCDNGIAAAGPIQKAKDAGIMVIVTDHHEVPYEEKGEKRVEILPPADVVVDPKQEGETYPYEGICGAVVAYKLMEAYFEETKEQCKQYILQESLPFAALATVCDVMELKDENRIFVKEGLRGFATCHNEGIKALINVSGLDIAHLKCHNLGFVIGPSLNATGRLDTALKALELLETENKEKAYLLAQELKELNDCRKQMTQDGIDQANAYIDQHGVDNVLVVYLPQVHESLAGIIAGKVREKYYRPTFILTDAEEGVKGSGRSIETYHMYDEMTKVKEIFTKYGGHKQAAGFSLKREDVDKLRSALNEKCTLKEDDFVPKIVIDVPMPLYYASLELAKQLEVLEPFGNGNAQPLFAQKDVCFKDMQYLGKQKNYLKFKVDTEAGLEDMIYFGDQSAFLEFVTNKFGEKAVDDLFHGRGQVNISIIYQIAINSYMGRESLQYSLKYYC